MFIRHRHDPRWKPGDRRDVPRFFGNAIIEKTGASRACWASRCPILPPSASYPPSLLFSTGNLGRETWGEETWGQTGRSPVFRERNNRENWGKSRLSGESMSYPSPVRFLPSIITLLNIRLIRVW
jgi:hypothetical protein